MILDGFTPAGVVDTSRPRPRGAPDRHAPLTTM